MANQLQSPDEFLAKVRLLYADPTATSFDVLQLRDGRILERFSQPQRLGDEIVGRVWSFRDVTQSRQLELELRQSQKMEALGRLAGGIAHDFNNLLMLISGYTRQFMENPSLAQARNSCEQILATANRAASVTKQLLAFSRKHSEAPTVADLNAIVLDMERMLRRLLSDQIELQISVAPDPQPVHVDISQIEVLIMNLAINAQDAMPQGGVLSITTATGMLSLTRPEQGKSPSDCAVLQVRDTGQGMTPEVQARIFEDFFTTKQPGKGTGLGLSTVSGIVDRAGGRIEVHSEPKHGTTFRIYLPYAIAALAAQPIAPSVLQPSRGNETILVAEDEAGIRAMTRAYLETLGYRVLEAANGTEAIKLSRGYSGTIHLVLTDLLMPGMRGDAAAEAIRMQRPGIKAVFMSGYTDQNVTATADNVLFKPFEFPDLGRRIRSVLDQCAVPAAPHADSPAA